MKLYLVQHAKAASKEQDPQRPLTKEGRQELRKICDFAEQQGITVDYIWHSGKKRAQQTAQLLGEVLSVNKALSPRDGLAPNDDVTAFCSEFDSLEGDIMVVGHLPFLSNLASLLLASDESRQVVRFANGGIVALERSEQGKWQLMWMVTPDLL